MNMTLANASPMARCIALSTTKCVPRGVSGVEAAVLVAVAIAIGWSVLP